VNKRKFLRTDEVRDIYGMRGSAFRKMCLTGKVTGAVKLDKLSTVLEGFFPVHKHKFIDMNMKAIEEGQKAV
jgi:hypothetical protein